MDIEADNPNLVRGRELQVEAEKQRKRGDLVEAGHKIAAAAIYHLKAICEDEQIPCESESEYFTAASEIARRFRQQNINKQFGAAMLLHLNGITDSISLTGDQIKTYFKDVQKLIHLVRERLR
jgi:hypothetical protein